MLVRKTEDPGGKAEGLCEGLPYTTELVSSEGVAVHFWVGEEYDKAKVALALHKARNERDVVCASWSYGQPASFWAHSDIK